MSRHPIIIAPSLLSADFTHLGEAVSNLEKAGADWHHVDVMDGHFVPNLTVGLPVVKALAGKAQRPLDVHIMIANPEEYAVRYVEAGATGVTFHLEAAWDPEPIARQLREAGGRVGLALSPQSPVTRLEPHLHLADMVLIMTVHPGFGGQSFMSEMLDKVRQVRYGWGYDGDLQVDGGISPDNVGACAEAGANCFVSGTAILGSPDPAATIRLFRDRAGAAQARRVD